MKSSKRAPYRTLAHLLFWLMLAAALNLATPVLAEEAASEAAPAIAEPVTAAAPTTASVVPATASSAYVVRAGDRVVFSMWGEPGLATDTTVMPDGEVAMPLVGSVEAAGRTVPELVQEIQKAYARFYKEPNISLSVIPRNPPQIYLAGNVAHPGPIAYDPKLRLLDYLGIAGGALPGADLTRVVVTSGESMNVAKITVNVEGESKGNTDTVNPVLKPWDTVWIGRALPVAVLGAVVQPGSFDYQRGLRLTDYVGMAGGPTNRARLRQVLLKRFEGGNGTVMTIDLSAALAKPGADEMLNPVLGPGDVITVPEAFLAGTLEWSDVLRGITSWIILGSRN